jgi:hypothetical protein
MALTSEIIAGASFRMTDVSSNASFLFARPLHII